MVPRPYIELLYPFHNLANFFIIIFIKSQNQLRKSLPKFSSKHLDFIFPLFSLVSNVEDSEKGSQFKSFLPLFENLSIEIIEKPKNFSDFSIKLVFPIIVGSA